MKKDLKCQNCSTDVVVIETKLFFSEEEVETNVNCPVCNIQIFTGKTDGWFFSQSKEESAKELQIEKNKADLTYPMP